MVDDTAITQANEIIDTFGVANAINGVYYDINGVWLGEAEKNTTNKVYIVDSVEKNEKGKVINALNIRPLSIDTKEFKKMAATVYGESSATYMKVISDELKKEMCAIAMVHKKNKIAFGATSAKAKEYKRLTPTQINRSPFKLASNAAVINAYLGGKDWSYGAVMWDGKEQAIFDTDDEHTKLGEISIELHMNTMGWEISDEHYSKWKKNIGDEFKAPQVKKAVSGKHKDKITLLSTAVYCRSIFWKYHE